MKSKILTTLLFAAGLLASWSSASAADSPRVIKLEANDTMKYNVTAITASPGEEITVELTNTGNLPKAAMGHNWVLLKSGVDALSFALGAAQSGSPVNNYLPDAAMSSVIAHIKLLGPKETDSVTFKVPDAPGDYTYLCTFPGHFQAGMHGILTVK